MDKKILVFNGGAVMTSKDSVNKFDINGEGPIAEVEATQKNIKKYLKDKKFPSLKVK